MAYRFKKHYTLAEARARAYEMVEAIDWLRSYCMRHGVTSVSQIVGAMAATHDGPARLSLAAE